MADLRTPRRAVGSMFLLVGGLFGVWASRIPAFVMRFDLSDDQLRLLLLCIALGAIASFPLAGRLADRLGAASLCRSVAAFYIVTLWIVPLVPTAWALGIALWILGAGLGSLDVIMNAWGAEVEQNYGHPTMSLFHAMFSLGTGLGAASGYVAVRTGLEVGPHFVLAGVVLGLTALAAASVPWRSQVAAPHDRPGFALPTGALALVGLTAFCASIGEGAVADWSAVFLLTLTQATEAQAALGFASFSAAMVVMRLAGDRVVRRLGPVTSTRLSGLFATVGIAIAILSPQVPWVLAGFSIMGLGYAVVAPLTFSRAAADPKLPSGQAIAIVATLNYGGMLVGPPLIGFIAEEASLQGAFLLLGVMSISIVFLARTLQTPGP